MSPPCTAASASPQQAKPNGSAATPKPAASRSAIVSILERVDGEPGVMILARDNDGREAAIYLDPSEGMLAADKLHIVCEPWTRCPVGA